jgi:rubrerythrin
MSLSNSAFHGISAFILMGVLTMILYPLCRKYDKELKYLIIMACCSSLILIVAGTLYFNYSLSVNSLIAVVIGLLFGISVIALIFFIGSKNLSSQASFLDQKVSLRNLLTVAMKMEGGAVLFYESTAKNISDSKAKELCLKLADDERKHAEIIAKLLNQWLPRPILPEFVDWIKKEMKRQNIFSTLLPAEISDIGILQYAAEQERKLGAFYSSFRKAFPEEWKKSYVQMLVTGEQEHERQLTDLFNQLI